MEKKYDVIALGELLIDFTMNGQSEQGNNMFEACPEARRAMCLHFLIKMARKQLLSAKWAKISSVRCSGTRSQRQGSMRPSWRQTTRVNTTLAFVHTFPDGDREFSFYRNPGADMMLTEDDVDPAFIAQTKIFHFGTLSMTHDACAAATKKAVQAAKDAGCLVSFDPNLRPPLWSSLDLAKEQMEYGFGVCDILKISDNEIQFVSGKEDYDEGIAYLQEKFHIPLILLTMGKDGSRAYYKGMRVERPGFSVKAIETQEPGIHSAAVR